MIPHLRQASAGDKAHVAGPDDGDFHVVLLLLLFGRLRVARLRRFA